MAGTFAEQATLAADAALKVKVKAALVKNAAYRADPSTTVTLSGVRKFAHAVITNPESWVQPFVDLVAYGNPTTAGAAPTVPSDSDVDYIVNTFFDRIGHGGE